MGSINLHAISLSLPLVSHSQAPRSPFRVNLPKQFLPSFCSPSESLQRCKHIPATFCLDESINRSLDSSESSLNEEVRCYVGKSAEAAVDRITLVPNDNLSLHSGALIVLATVASKILGFLREIILAAVFGVGPVATAFKYAWVLPGLFSSLLGGVNGPVHVTMATTLSKLSAERRRKLFQSTNVMMFLFVDLARRSTNKTNNDHTAKATDSLHIFLCPCWTWLWIYEKEIMSLLLLALLSQAFQLLFLASSMF